MKKIKNTKLFNLITSYNSCIHYSILNQKSILKNGLVNLFALSAMIEKGPTKLEKLYLVVVEDTHSLHCISICLTAEEVMNAFKHFYKILNMDLYTPLVEYSFPDVFPVKTIVLTPL